MKLSAKWLTALAAVALLVVAVASLSSNKPASAATNGNVWVSNEWSKLTNETGNPSGYITTTSVYGTYSSATRLIEPLSNRIRIVVVDADLNVSTQVYDDTAGTANLGSVGVPAIVTLTDATKPIAGSSTTIKVWDAACDGGPVDPCSASTVLAGDVGIENDLVAGGQVAIAVGNAGNGISVPGYVVITPNIAGSAAQNVTIEYPSSAKNEYSTGTYVANAVRVRTDVSNVSGGEAFVFIKETGLNTGRFVGYVDLVALDTVNNLAANSSAAGELGAQVELDLGTVTINYNDGGTTREARVFPDLSAPVVTIVGPTNNLSTRSRTPFFSGSVNESGSGLKLVTQTAGPAGSFALFVDESDDAANADPVLDAAGAGLAGDKQSAIIGTVADGQLTMNFNQQNDENELLPTGVAIPDHRVDFQARVSDLAGNIGFSDSDTTITTAPAGQGNGTVVTGGFSAHVVRIDKVVPTISTTLSDHMTGINWNGTTEVADAAAIKLKFSEPILSGSLDAADFLVTLDSGTPLAVVGSPLTNGSYVYLKMVSSIPPKDTPRIELLGNITDLATNQTSGDSISGVSDGIKPTLTVTLSGGTGIGTGDDANDKLTKQKMTITVTSNESLAAAPVVLVYVLSGGLDQTPTVLTSIDDPNKWSATFDGAVGPASGSKAIVVTGEDVATTLSPAALTNNATAVGATATKSFRLDEGLVVPTVTPTGTVTTTSPNVKINYVGEDSAVTLTEVTLTGSKSGSRTVKVNVSSDNKLFFFREVLAEETWTLTIPAAAAKDAAGNTNSAQTFVFIVGPRAKFSVPIAAGWQLISFPSRPEAAGIDSVFSNKGIELVVTFKDDGTVVTTAKDKASNKFGPGTATIEAGVGYWVLATDYEPQTVALTGEDFGGGRPDTAQIRVVDGWNLVGVVDASRVQTQGNFGQGLVYQTQPTATIVTASAYFAGVSPVAVYRYNTSGITSKFERVFNGDQVKIGDGLWIYVDLPTGVTQAFITP